MALGIVLTPYGKLPTGNPPYGITYAWGGNGTFLEPTDPYQYQRGEAGFYSDTPLGYPRRGFFKRLLNGLGLGRIPTDFQIARGNYPFTPQYSGWINTQQGYVTGPWLPPNGWAPDGVPQPVEPLETQTYPRNHGPIFSPSDYYVMNGLRDAAPMVPASTEDVIALMNAHNDRVFALTIVSTTAVAVSAILTVFRTLKLIKEDR